MFLSLLPERNFLDVLGWPSRHAGAGPTVLPTSTRLERLGGYLRWTSSKEKGYERGKANAVGLRSVRGSSKVRIFWGNERYDG